MQTNVVIVANAPNICIKRLKLKLKLIKIDFSNATKTEK